LQLQWTPGMGGRNQKESGGPTGASHSLAQKSRKRVNVKGEGVDINSPSPSRKITSPKEKEGRPTVSNPKGGRSKPGPKRGLNSRVSEAKKGSVMNRTRGGCSSFGNKENTQECKTHNECEGQEDVNRTHLDGQVCRQNKIGGGLKGQA